MNIGASNRSIYDTCAYTKQIYESTQPLAYALYAGYGENCNKCVDDRFYVKYEPALINIDSELKNLTRPISKCDQFKYNPNCSKSGLCTSTFDRTVPVVPAPETCPIVYNNIPRFHHAGYVLPNPNICKGF